MELRLPSLGPDMETAVLLAWLVAPGDRIEHGQVVAEVETDKGIIEVECWHSGVLEQILAEPGPEPLPVGTPIAVVRTDEPETPSPPATPAAPGAGGTTRPRATPLARRLAARLGIDLETVAVAGGVITADDVRSATGATADSAVEGPSNLRAAVARTMARSKREIPHYYLATHIDLGPAIEWLNATNATRPIAGRLLFPVLLLKATALAARSVPEVNGHWTNDGFHASDAVHLGVAVSLRNGGVVAPSIRNAHLLGLDDLAQGLRALVESARSGRVRSSAMSEATLTVTNLGERGVETVFPVIVPPQVAMVGFGTVADRVTVVEGELRTGPASHATLAADHRVSDGHTGSRFLRELAGLLAEPERL